MKKDKNIKIIKKYIKNMSDDQKQKLKDYQKNIEKI